MNKKTMGALLLFLGAVATMVYVFDRLQIIDARALAIPYLVKIPVVRTWVQPAPLNADALLAEERALQQEALDLANETQQDSAADLDRRVAELKQQEENIRTAQEMLDQRQEEVRQQTAEREAEEARYKKLVELFSNMQPAAAARIMAATDTVTGEPQVEDETIMAILQRMDPASAGYVMTFMPPERASAIVRKLGH